MWLWMVVMMIYRVFDVLVIYRVFSVLFCSFINSHQLLLLYLSVFCIFLLLSRKVFMSSDFCPWCSHLTRQTLIITVASKKLHRQNILFSKYVVHMPISWQLIVLLLLAFLPVFAVVVTHLYMLDCFNTAAVFVCYLTITLTLILSTCPYHFFSFWPPVNKACCSYNC